MFAKLGCKKKINTCVCDNKTSFVAKYTILTKSKNVSAIRTFAHKLHEIY